MIFLWHTFCLFGWLIMFRDAVLKSDGPASFATLMMFGLTSAAL